MLILLAEDDPKISKLLYRLLHKDGYQVDLASDGEEALMYVEMNTYGLVILDWMMPLVSGLEVCKKLREKGFDGGILMLTAKDSTDDKVMGLEAGADDYLVKPFDYKELKARLDALIRRSKRQVQDQLVHKGIFSVDRKFKTAYCREQDMQLSMREFQLFSLLFDYGGAAVPRSMLIDQIWGIDGEVSDNNLDAFIRLLRKKLKQYEERPVIINSRGIGYRLEVYDV